MTDLDLPASEFIRRETAAGRDWRESLARQRSAVSGQRSAEHGGVTDPVGPATGLVPVGQTPGGAMLAVPAKVAERLAVCRAGCGHYEPDSHGYGRCSLIEGCCGRFLAELQRGRYPEACPLRGHPDGLAGVIEKDEAVHVGGADH